MAAARIVVVEDEPAIAGAVADRLRAAGYEVHIAGDGPAGVELVQRIAPDLVVLDVMLPGFDGHEVCRRIQAERAVPVLMLTARGEEADLLAGLEVGADDYLAKPFSPRELVARVGVLLRRVERAGSAGRVQVGRVAVDLDARQVQFDGEPVHLAPMEFALLAHLAARPGRVLTRDQLLAEVWGWHHGGTRTVDTHVRALRRKLGETLVRTVHGVGYAIDTGEPA